MTLKNDYVGNHLNGINLIKINFRIFVVTQYYITIYHISKSKNETEKYKKIRIEFYLIHIFNQITFEKTKFKYNILI